jgi:DNA polymerase-3 subunit epsilon/CBS domain-containing protein
MDSAGTPLVSLSAVILDTETTSLDPKKARIVEIGAARLARGALDGASFATRVDPGIPIPSAATAIHGIDDAAVKGKPSFREAMTAYAAFAGLSLILGYSLDFDFAVLAAEHKRLGLPWTPPPALDVHGLVALIDPPLPDQALDTVAISLGIAIENRHSALGDAILTAKVFLGLLPALRAKNIRTLGEAMTALRNLDTARPAGEATIRATPSVVPSQSRVDSFPYRHRVGDLMSSPPITIAASRTLGEALALLMERKVSSAFVEPDGKGWGIITERDILRAIAADPKSVLKSPVRATASFPLQNVSPDDFVYKALGRMRRKRFRHLGVADAHGAPIGALTQRDLLRQRADEAIALSDALSEASSVADMALIFRQLAGAARALMDERTPPRDIAAIVSAEVVALTAHAARLAAAEMPAPCPARYCVFVLGSAGRGESLLALDQDNAIIHDGGEDAEKWLAAMAARMNAILHEIGVPLCKGGVMAKNPEWRKDVEGWRKHVASWLSRTAPKDILNADIFFDAAGAYGEAHLCEALLADARAAARQSIPFLKLVSLGAVQAVRPPLGWFGRFSLENGRTDLKKGGLLPIVSAARVMALRHGIAERSTLGRLEALRGKEEVPEDVVDRLQQAHQTLLSVILSQQLEDIAKGEPPSSRVDPSILHADTRDALRWSLEQVKSVSDLLGDPLAG